MNRKLFEVGYADFEVLEPILSSFTKTTGLTIDPYATTRMYAGHIGFIMSLIREYLLKLQGDKPKEYEMLSSMLTHFESVQGGFIIVGD